MTSFLAELLIIAPIIAVVLIILYFIIRNAVTNGINRSEIAELLIEFEEEDALSEERCTETEEKPAEKANEKENTDGNNDEE